MASGLASFNARRNVAARAITVSTIQGSSIATTSITTGTLSLSTLTGSTMTSNTLAISTLTVSSINSGAPGVAAYSTFNASSINTSSITTSSITTAPGYNSNISNVIYTSLADSGQTAASFTAASLPATAPAGSVISGSYRLTAGASSGAAVMRLSSYTFVVGTTYNFTFTGTQGSQALALYVYQYNSAGTASTQISASVYSITTSAATVSGSFTPNASGTYTGTIVFYFQAAAVNQYVNFTAFSMTVGAMNVGIGMSNPIAKLQINQDGNSNANEVGSHSMGILSNQGTSGTNLMYMMMDADFTNQCCSIQSIVYGLKVWNLNLNPRGGNVGIGTTNPGAVLHVSDSLTTATSIPLMLFSPNLSAGGAQYLYFGTANSANNSAQIGWANVGAGSASNYAFLQIYGKANIMTWQASTGNVGIGTTNPVANLHVHNSSSSFTGSPTVHIGDGQIDAGGTYGMAQLVRANNAADNKAHLSFIKNGLTVFGMGYYPGSNISAFGLVPSFSSMATANGLWILTNGYVGIGMTNPTNRLDTFDGVARTGTHATGRALYATFSGAEYSNGIAEFRHTNGTQGIGIGYAGLYACGSITDQEFNIIAKGTGLINLRSATRLTGAGDNCMTYYGPNATWSAYLVVGAGSDKSGGSTAQVISTNGNLHLDAGNSNAIYYGHYTSARGTPNPHYFYGTDIQFSSGIPQQVDTYSYPVVMCGARLYKSQAMMRERYRNNSVSWGGGVNITYAFYKYNGYVSVKISGKLSYYVGSATRAYPYIRFYSHSSGATWTYSFENYTNNGGNHVTFPIELMIFPGDFSYTGGWFDVYVYNAGNCGTDTNDQLWINAEVLPGSDF